MQLTDIQTFAAPFYTDKDVMHDLSHIERVLKSFDKLAVHYQKWFDRETVLYAAYFHGIIYSHETEIREWLTSREVSSEKIDTIIKVSWESQRDQPAKSLEGKLLHDAHMIEGGKAFLALKSLITGSLRGQTLEETMDYIQGNIIGKGICYLPESREIYAEQLKYADQLLRDLRDGLR